MFGANSCYRPFQRMSVGRMNRTFYDFLDGLLGLRVESQDLTFLHMAARACVVFFFGVILARVGDRRFLGRNAGFDAMLVIILGSVLSRGVNGQAAFLPTLGASAVLVLLHHLLATATFRSHWLSWLAKGRSRVLVRNGEVDQSALRGSKITSEDLGENLRMNGNILSPADVKEARLERNGQVSVVKG